MTKISLVNKRVGLVCFFSLFLTACAIQPEQAPLASTERLLSGTVLLGEPLRDTALPDEDILGLSPELRAYLAKLAPDASPQQRLQALLRAFEQREFTVLYDADSTLNASETYIQQRGNCMAFTVMMVAMARELGVDAQFNQVAVPPVWDHSEAQTFVVYRHINMVSESARGRRVVDFNLAAYDPVYDQNKVSDTAAFAQFYSNRGLELMRQDKRKSAFLYLRKALQLRPQDSDLWANLGALYSRYSFYAEAEQSYRYALQLDSSHAIAMSNLERLYRKNNQLELAEYYAKRARHHRENNPYYLYYQARNAYEHGEFKQAKKQLRRALWKYEDDHRFHFLMGLTNYRLGEFVESKEHFFEAFHLANNPSAKNAYMRKLEIMDSEIPTAKRLKRQDPDGFQSGVHSLDFQEAQWWLR